MSDASEPREPPPEKPESNDPRHAAPDHPETEDSEQDLGLEQFLSPSDDQGLSLDALSRTYAELLGSGEDPYVDDQAAEGEEAEGAVDEEEPEELDSRAADPRDDTAGPITPATILEAMLFVGHPENEPLTSKKIAALMRGVSPREIDELVSQWNQSYAEWGSAYHIVSAGSGYRLELRPELAGLREKFHGRVKAARLSQLAIDVLAIVAYHQPITKDRVERMRGRPVGAALSQLVRRELLCLERRPDKPRKPYYRTTARFLELFALDSLEDLPRSQELERGM